jgi:hypothetical protein
MAGLQDGRAPRYNADNEKLGVISELIVDRSGKVEAVVVGTGGGLHMGERDVAVPYNQVQWAYQPVTGAANTASQTWEDARSYPDHAVLNITKDQLATAPAFLFFR